MDVVYSGVRLFFRPECYSSLSNCRPLIGWKQNSCSISLVQSRSVQSTHTHTHTHTHTQTQTHTHTHTHTHRQRHRYYYTHIHTAYKDDTHTHTHTHTHTNTYINTHMCQSGIAVTLFQADLPGSMRYN